MNDSVKTRAKTTETSLEIVDTLRQVDGADLKSYPSTSE